MSWLKIRDTIGLTLRPVDNWPGKRLHGRDRGPFSATLADTLDILRRELRELNAKNIVLQIDLREKDFRQDGLPRADARPTDVGVILSFSTPKGPRRKAFDRFHNYEQNLRALAMNLHHLRMSNHHGVESDQGQYAGWKALAAPEEEIRTWESAADWLYAKTGVAGFYTEPETLQQAFRVASRKMHPDQGGDPADFRKLMQVMEILRKGKS